MEEFAGRDLFEGGCVEDVVGARHRAAATFKTADVADVEFDFVRYIGIFRLIFVTHIVLFFLIA